MSNVVVDKSISFHAGLADFKEEEPIKPKIVERTDAWR